MGNNQELNSRTEGENRFAALQTNVEAIRVIAGAVKGTLGPKGLDTMLVDQIGDVVITNDGVTILNLMEVNHPAAKMLINIARAQQEEVGDGTTTATIMAGEMVSKGYNMILQGVPVARIIEGIKKAIEEALEDLQEKSTYIEGLDDPVLKNIALVAGRGYEDIAKLVVRGAQIVGREKLQDPSFKLVQSIKAIEGAKNEVFLGVLINKERVNKQMPKEIEKAKILIIDDALEPETIEDEALSTENGFAKYLELREEFQKNVQKIAELGINVVLVDRGVDDLAEEILTDAGILVVQRVAHKELRSASEHTGAKMIKRTGLKKSLDEIKKCIGKAEKVCEDEKLENIRIINGHDKPVATIIVSASTAEVAGERERIAKDAASSVQAAVKGGFVPGGGTVELSIAGRLQELEKNIKGMNTFGIKCVISALEKPFMQIVSNAGFNPLEKIGDITQAQFEKNSFSLGVDCDNGQIINMVEKGIIDPTLVKIHALKAAGEISEAILRINTIIRKREKEIS